MRRVVLLSGGLDSYLAYRYSLCLWRRKEDEQSEKPIPLFVDYGQPYLEKELAAVKSLNIDDLRIVKADLVTPLLDNVPTVQKQEVWGRNLLLAFYGGLLGDEVWLSSLETEMNPTAVRDKQPEFLSMMSALLTFLMKGKRLETRVTTPFADWTKTDVIYEGLNAWGVTEEELRKTVSCYDETSKYCGACSTCFKRWIAMTNNQIDEPYLTEPWKNDYAQKVIPQMRKLAHEFAAGQISESDLKLGRFSYSRIVETNWALEEIGEPSLWPEGSPPRP